MAAYYAAEAALRHLKPGSQVYTRHICYIILVNNHIISIDFVLKNYSITETVDKIAESYKCKPVEGMLSYQLEKNLIDGKKHIIQNPNEMQKYALRLEIKLCPIG